MKKYTDKLREKLKLFDDESINKIIEETIMEAQEDFLQTYLEDKKNIEPKFYTTEERFFLRNTFLEIIKITKEADERDGFESDFNRYLNCATEMTDIIFKKAKNNNYF